MRNRPKKHVGDESNPVRKKLWKYFSHVENYTEKQLLLVYKIIY